MNPLVSAETVRHSSTYIILYALHLSSANVQQGCCLSPMLLVVINEACCQESLGAQLISQEALLQCI